MNLFYKKKKKIGIELYDVWKENSRSLISR